MIKNMMIVDRNRFGGMNIQIIMYLDIIIITDDEKGVFWYSKNRYTGIVDYEFPIKDLDAHMRIIESIQR